MMKRLRRTAAGLLVVVFMLVSDGCGSGSSGGGGGIGRLAGTISILGIEIATDDATDFEDASEEDIDGTDFFLQVRDGDLVEYTDYSEAGQPADGIADEVEFED